jgi:hypothetical protein
LTASPKWFCSAVIAAEVTVPCPAKNSGWHGVCWSGVHVENRGNVARIAVYGRQEQLSKIASLIDSGESVLLSQK